jgi:hypothetical protein
MDHQNLPARISIPTACAVIGGDKPISKATYYRGAKAGIYPPPDRVSPNISRVNTAKLMAAITARTKLET